MHSENDDCFCMFCERDKKFDAWLAALPSDAKEFAEDIYEQLNDVEEDNEYLYSLVAGTHPDADNLINEIRLDAKRDRICEN